MKKVLFYSISFTILLYLFRVVYTGSFLFLFVPWNLFLAGLPLLFSSQIKTADINLRNSLLFCLWLLFFPNSAYMITDLFHLGPRVGVPMYFDLVLLFSAAWNGLLMGLLSLKSIEDKFHYHFSLQKVRMISASLFFLCGFGIYLGRFERHNSWHIVTHPFDLAKDIAVRFIYPWEYQQTWAVTILFSVALMLIYETLKALNLHSGKVGNKN